MATIRQKGPNQWHVQVRRKGWPAVTTTKRTRKEAEAWGRQIESEMDKGTYVDRSLAAKKTFGDLLRSYLEDVTKKRPGEESRAAEESRINRILREETALCTYAVANLTPELFENYRDRRLQQFATRGKPGGRGQYKAEEYKPKLRKDGSLRANAAKPKDPEKPKKKISPGTVKRELTLLKNVIGKYKSKLGLVINPVNTEDVRRPVVNDERDVRLEEDQIKALIEQCRMSRNKWLAPLVEVAFETGARRGSLLHLEWKDVDLEKRTALLRGVKNSRNPGQVIDILIAFTPRAVQILEGLDRSDDHVFPLSANALKGAFERARKRVGVSHFRFHDTRHERTSSLIEAGWDDTKVMAQTGHKDPKSLKRYSNLRRRFLADELAKLPSPGESKEERIKRLTRELESLQGKSASND